MTCVDMPRRSWRVREVATTATHRWLAHLPRRLLFGTSRHVGAFCVPSRQPLAAATRAAHDMCGHAPQILARARGRYHCHAPVACTFAKPAAFRHQPANKHGGARSGGSGGRRAGGSHPDQASGQPGAACAPLGEQAPPPAAAILHSFGRAGFSGFKHPNGIHRWIRIRVVRNHFISTQASRSGLGAARGSTPRFGTQKSLPCIAWRSWRRGR